MAIRGNGLLYALLIVLVPVLLAACLEPEQLSRAILPTSSPSPSQTTVAVIEQTIEQATETPLALLVASPAPIRAPVFAAQVPATPTLTPIPPLEDQFEITDAASESAGVPVDDAFKAVQERGTSLGQFAVVLNSGSDLTVLRSIEGGAIIGEVADGQLGPDLVTKKHLATISYEPFTMQFGMNMSSTFADWIEGSFDGVAASKNGTVIAANSNLYGLSEREFRDALISEVTFPTLDASSKDQAFFTVKLEPERIIYQSSAGDLTFDTTSTSKKWLASNFRVEIGDLPTDRVSKIDSFTWKQAILKDEVGKFREPTLEPTRIVIPDLKLSISMADIQPWLDWHKDFVIDGEATDGDELTGSITFLAPDLQEELAVVELFNIGIISISLDKAEANKDSIARFAVELYVEDMSFEFKADTTSTSLQVTTTAVPSTATPQPIVVSTPVAEVPVTATPEPVVVVTPEPIVVPTADTVADAPPKVQLLALPDMVGPTVSFQYRLLDSTSDPVSVDVSFSLDQGKTFRKASRSLRSEGTSGLSSSPSGVIHTFTWNAGVDIATEQESKVVLRVSPNDGDSKGRPEATEPFEYHALLDQVARLCKIDGRDWSLSARLWASLHANLSRCQNDLLEQVDSLLQETEPDLGPTLLRRVIVKSSFEVLNEMLDSVDASLLRLQELSGSVVNKRVSAIDLNESLRNQDSLIDELEAKLSSIGDDTQLANTDLQNNLQKQQQVLQTLSNVSKMLHDTAMAVIRKIG